MLFDVFFLCVCHAAGRTQAMLMNIFPSSRAHHLCSPRNVFLQSVRITNPSAIPRQPLSCSVDLSSYSRICNVSLLTTRHTFNHSNTVCTSRISSSEFPPLPPPPRNVSLLSVLPYLWDLASKDPGLGWRLFGAVFLLLGGKVAGILGPLFLKFAMDKLQSAPNDLRDLSPKLVLGALVFSAFSKAIGAGMNEMRYVVFAPLGYATGRRVAVHLLDHILHLDLTFHLEKSSGLLERIIVRAQRAVVHVFRAIVFTFIPTAVELGCVCTLLAKQVNITVAGVVLVTFVAYILWTIKITDAAASSRKEAIKIEGLATGKIMDVLLNFELVTQSNTRKLEVHRYHDLLMRHQNVILDAEHLSATLNAGQAFILAAGVASVMALSGLSVTQGSMTIGDLVLANGLILQISAPLQFLGFLYRDLRQSLLDLDFLFNILITRPSVKDGHIELQKVGPGMKIQAENLHFRYRSSRKILNGVSLTANPGESIAIVGPSGCGKSTIVKLLLRFYYPELGTLFLDNIDLQLLSQASLHGAIAIVPQDTVLFNDTIYHNITYSRPTACKTEIIQAAKQALSGGEKQRVAIARAFLKAPRLLICDEATSALDSNTEVEVLKTLKDLSSGRTCIFVAHRLSTIMHCDKILVMDNGSIIEEGTHKDLLSRGGTYANMWSSQELKEKREPLPK
ncbi:hypothetical protein KP509_08G045800 [Ceratopteris richardii]|uniref:Uncharacterized protein n=1 Tax=Ceratopteris richardii TaxID=49495 RepID=A0A8T2UDM5_CERRI|nr:hypothetical protein KP509_08G045800 [Ceratopteris richardii]